MYREVARPEKQIPTRKFVKKSYSTGQLVVKPVSDATAVELSFSPKDSGNVFEAHVDSKGTMTIDRGALEDDFIVRAPLGSIIVPANKLLKGKKLTIDTSMLLNDGVIHCNRGDFKSDYLFENKGRLVTAGDCTLRMPQSYFRNSGYGQLGVLNIKGNLTYEGLGSVFENKAGTISVDKNIVIEASEVRNRPQPNRRVEDKQSFKYKRPLGKTVDLTEHYAKECENWHEEATSGPGTITCAGSCQITAHAVANSASTVHSEGPLTITATRVHNNRHLLKHLTCAPANAYTIGKLTRGEYDDLLPACLSSGDSVTFILNGVSYKHSKGTLSSAVRLQGLHNTGHIIAKQNIGALKNSQTDSQLATSVFNGPQKASEHQPRFAYKAEMLSLVPQEPLVKALPQARLSPESPYYKHVSTVNETAEPLGIDEIVCINGAPNRFTSDTKFLYSPQLQAQLVSQVLFKHTTGSFLYGLSDLMSQFTELKERGFLYGLVHGELHKLPDKQEEPLPVFISDHDRAQLKEALALFDTRHSMTEAKIEARLRLIRSGKYALTLKKETITNAPCSFLYYDCFKNELVPYVHISKQDFDKNLNFTGSLRAKNISLNVSKVVNTGSIIAFDKVEIKAQSFKNTRLVHKKIDKYTTQDVWGNYHTYQYQIRTPQPGGQVLGFVVEVEVPEEGTIPDVGGHKGILNKGGTIEGTCKVSLIAKQGNVDNRHVLSSTVIPLDRGFFGGINGRSPASVAHDFKAGQIKSQGDVELFAEAGKVLNIASSIIADKNVKLKGYGGVLLKTMANKHTAFSSGKLNGLTYQELATEGYTVGQAQVIAQEGNIDLESANIVESQGGYTQSGGDTNCNGAKGNKIGAARISTATTVEQASLWWPPAKKQQITVEHILQPEMKTGGKLNFLTELDNVIEAAIMTETGAIYVTAGRDNIFKGATAKTTVEDEQFNLGISFFGKQALESLWAQDPAATVISLAEQDPLVRSLMETYQTVKQEAGGAGQATISLFEAVRLFVQYQAQAKAAGADFSKMRLLAQRLGAVDGQGNFEPRVRLQFGYTTKQQVYSQQHQTEIKTGKLHTKSGRDTNWNDGTTAKAKEATLEVGRDFNSSPATSQTDTTIKEAGLHVDATPQGIFGVGASGSSAHAHQKTHQNGRIEADILKMGIEGDLNQKGTTIKGEDTEVNVGGNLNVETVQDTGCSHSTSGEGTFGASGSFSGSYNHEDGRFAETGEESSIEGTKKLKVKVKKKIKAKGARFSSDNPESTIEAESFEAETLHDYTKTSSHGFAGSTTYPNSGPDGVHSIFYPSSSYSTEEGTTQTTIDGPQLKTKKPAPYVNRDRSKMRTRLPRVVGHLKMVLPLVDLQRLGDTISQFEHAKTPEERKYFKDRADRIMDSSEPTLEKVEDTSQAPEDKPQETPASPEPEPQDRSETQEEPQKRDVKTDVKSDPESEAPVNQPQEPAPEEPAEQAPQPETPEADAGEKKKSGLEWTDHYDDDQPYTPPSQPQEPERPEPSAPKEPEPVLQDPNPKQGPDLPWYVADVTQEDETKVVKVAVPLEDLDLEKLASLTQPDVLEQLKQQQQALLLQLVERSLQEGYFQFSIPIPEETIVQKRVAEFKSNFFDYINRTYTKTKQIARFALDYSVGFTMGVTESYLPINLGACLSDAEEYGRRDGHVLVTLLGALEIGAGLTMMGLGAFGESFDGVGPDGAAVAAMSRAFALVGGAVLTHGTAVVYFADNKLKQGNLNFASSSNSSGNDSSDPLTNNNNKSNLNKNNLDNKPNAQNLELQDCINQLYRPDAKIGSGSTADAIRHELKTGELVGGKSHIRKGIDRVRQLKNLLRKQKLSAEDYKTAHSLLQDLQNALIGK